MNPYYLPHHLESKIFLDQVYRSKTETAIPWLLDSDLLNVLVLLPSTKKQDRIGAIVEGGFEQRK